MTVYNNNSSDLCALPDVRDVLFRGSAANNAPTGDVDNVLQRLITAASKYILNDISRNIFAANYTRRLNGQGTKLLFLPDTPITAVSSLYIDGVLIPAKDTDPLKSANAVGYTIQDDYIALSGYTFNAGIDNVIISYTAGNNSVPADLQDVCIDMVTRKYRELDRIGVNVKSIGQEQMTYDRSHIGESSKRTLQRYQRVIPV